MNRENEVCFPDGLPNQLSFHSRIIRIKSFRSMLNVILCDVLMWPAETGGKCQTISCLSCPRKMDFCPFFPSLFISFFTSQFIPAPSKKPPAILVKMAPLRKGSLLLYTVLFMGTNEKSCSWSPVALFSDTSYLYLTLTGIKDGAYFSAAPL